MNSFAIVGVFLAAVLVLFLYMRNPRRMAKVMPVFNKIWQSMVPYEFESQMSGLTRSKIAALNDTPSISKMLLLHSYQNIEKDDFGFFNLVTGRIGIGFEITPPPVVTPDVIAAIKNSMRAIDIKDVAVQIMTFASTDINFFIEGIKRNSGCNVNVGNIRGLEVIRDDRIAKTRKWSQTSMLKNGADLRARNLISLITFVFPKDTPIPKIKKIYNEVKGNLNSLNPIRISPTLVSKMYGEILKNDSSLKDYDIHQKMNTQLAKNARIRINAEDSTININNEIFAKVLSPKKFPEETNIFEMQNAFFALEGEFQQAVPSRFLLSLTIHIDDPERQTKRILKRARANVSNRKKLEEDTNLLNPTIMETVEESAEVIQYIEKDKEQIFEGMYSLIIFEDSINNLEASVGRIKNKLSKINVGGFYMEEENFGLIALQTLLWSLPFQFDIETKDHLNRFNLLWSSNISAIAPLIGTFKGNSVPTLKFFARTGQVVGIDLWESDTNYNSCIIGPSGSGKSFLSNNIQMCNAQAGVKTIIFDIGRSYKPLCDEIKGEFIKFDNLDEKGEKRNMCLNFYTNITTTKVNLEDCEKNIVVGYTNIMTGSIAVNGVVEFIEEDEFGGIMTILGAMMGQDFSKVGDREGYDTDAKSNEQIMSALLLDAVKIAFFRKKREAGLREIGEALETLKDGATRKKEFEVAKMIEGMKLALSPYSTPSGQFYSYYNGAYNIDTENDFSVIELEELTQKGDLYFIVLMSMLQRAAADTFFDRNRKKMVVIDEAARLLQKKVFASYLEDFARRFRKYNGALMIITQSPDDFSHNSSAVVIWQSSCHKFILQVDATTVANNQREGRIFDGYPEYRIKQIQSVKNHAPEYNEIFYFYSGKVSEILLFKATAQEEAMFSTNPKDTNIKTTFQEKHGLTPVESTKALGLYKEGLEEEEIVKRIKTENSDASVEFWMGKIRTAIRNPSLFYPTAQKIYNKNGEVAYHETKINIMDAKNKEKLYKINDFFEVAKDNKYLGDIGRGHFAACINYYSPKDIYFSVDIHQTQAILPTIESFIQIAAGYEKVIIEIAIERKLSPVEITELTKFAKKVREANGIIALDKINLESFEWELLENTKAMFLKIDSKFIKKALADEGTRARLEVFPNIIRSFGAKSIAAHIDTQKEFQLVRKMGFDYFQGDFFSPFVGIEYMAENNITEEAAMAFENREIK